MITTPGAVEPPKSILRISTGVDLGFLIVAELLLLVVAFLCVSRSFRRRKSPATGPRTTTRAGE